MITETYSALQGAHTALFALGNLLILCPEFKVAYETQDLMSILVRLLADTLDPRLSMLGLQVTSVAASKVLEPCRVLTSSNAKGILDVCC